ncbi:hypothetical protein G6F50_016765 [Rhizopus delemar]|uniref:Uncharacterized protein n=1 Tax=Rhizopus delemar TaxID=936053 RepID=A0A9P6XSJ7_9FUNG|nr:hypothetical protein G6F50_016765 [Rhizopus delemar]
MMDCMSQGSIGASVASRSAAGSPAPSTHAANATPGGAAGGAAQRGRVGAAGCLRGGFHGRGHGSQHRRAVRFDGVERARLDQGFDGTGRLPCARAGCLRLRPGRYL